MLLRLPRDHGDELMYELSPAAARDVSRPGAGDAFRAAQDDTSPLEERRLCRWCRQPLVATVRRDALACSRKCRQTAWRLRQRHVAEVLADRSLRFIYADPPYPGLSSKYYRHEPSYAGEVNHRALIVSLEASADGWALSTSARALRELLPLCPESARVCPWVKPKGTPSTTYGLHNSWEPVIVKPGRAQRPGVRDWLMAHAARGGGELPGRKPIAFCAWLFKALGMRPGDELVDLFPGTGIVGRAWRELGGKLSPPAPADTSPLQERHLSPAGVGDLSSAAAGDTSEKA